jgi:hypothetical protein
MTVESPNVKGIWTTIEIDEQGVETVLIVETDLELNAALPAFDVAKVDALIEAATKSFAASGGTIDRIHLVPIRRGMDDQQALKALVERVESLVSTEHAKWITRQEYDPKKVKSETAGRS